MASKTYVRTGRFFDPGPAHAEWYGEVSDIALGDQFTADLSSDAEAWLLQQGVITLAPRGTPGSGGSGSQLYGFAGQVSADAATSLPCDGHNYQAQVIKATPPSWLDGGGQIVLPGLYQISLSISFSTLPTTANGFVGLGTGFSGGALLSFDEIKNGPLFLTDYASLLAADLPYPALWSIAPPTDATAVLTVQPSAWRLLS